MSHCYAPGNFGIRHAPCSCPFGANHGDGAHGFRLSHLESRPCLGECVPDAPIGAEPVPADGQWAGATYAEHAAWLAEHAAAYVGPWHGDGIAYGEHYAHEYGRTALEDCPSHADEFPRWARAR